MGDYSAQLDFSKGGSEQNGKAAKQGRPWHSGIPMRIDLYERLEIRASKIPGAGRGMFALDAIGSSEVIFEIPTPIFCIVDEKRIDDTCDFCFTHVPEGSARQLEKCQCGTVSYCNEACKTFAWERYHQHECQTLRDSFAASNTDERKVFMKRHTRFLMRALLLQASGKMTPAEWNELCELKAFKRENLVRDYEALALCAMRCARNQFSKETVVRLLHAYRNNNCVMETRIKSNPDVEKGTPLDLGSCLEPWFSMINHNCAPNTTWKFDGRKLILYSERAIAEGEELTNTYAGDEKDGMKRRKRLRDLYGFECRCDQCMEELEVDDITEHLEKL